MNTNDFEIQWQHRKNALKDAENNAPSDDVVLNMAKIAQNRAFAQEMSPVRHRRLLWIPYVAAACLLAGVLLYGLHLPNEEVKFLCNSGCSAQDVIISANKIVNQE